MSEEIKEVVVDEATDTTNAPQMPQQEQNGEAQADAETADTNTEA